ncbi:MAG: RraA family protein [Pseudomonadota bacterium]
MIEEPPVLQIQKPARRPTDDQIAKIASYPTGFLCDAMDGRGALSPDLGWLDVHALPTRFCGVALTSDNGPDDLLGLLASLGVAQAGDVLVAATGPWRTSAVAGDRVMGMAKNNGCVGFVTDGLVRDHEGLIEVGLPIITAGMSPNSPYTKGPGKVGTPVIVGGVRIETGDIISADRTGTVVVPFDHLDAVIAAVENVEGLEAELDAKVAEGLTVPDAIKELLASDNVRWL